MTDTTATASPTSAAFMLSERSRRYAMWLLLVIYILNFIDRQIVNAVAELIKNDLGLSDTEVGLMTGFAFAVFYTVLGLPIARLADRTSRPLIISVALGIWSLFTVLSGFATNITQMLLARIGVGVGEAGCSPPAHSLISDINPKDKRASALAFYALGIPIGAVLGTSAGGVLAGEFGWRMAFVICGLPGVILAIITLFTLVEPRARGLAVGIKAVTVPAATIGEVLRTLATKRTFWLVAFAAAIKSFIGYGHAPFTASFFLRVHGDAIQPLADWMGLERIGALSIMLAVFGGVGGVIGTLLGGRIADHYGRLDYRAWCSVPGIASLIVIPLFVTAMLMPSPYIAIPIFAVTAILGTLWYGPVFATAQSIVPPHMRAVAAAILLFVINLIGLGLGPVAVGALSDLLANGFGMGKNEGLRWALIISAFAGVGAFVLFWLARKTIRQEMAD